MLCWFLEKNESAMELEDWDWHINTIDTMHKIDNQWEYMV